ncbi:DUF896 domain-containing protein [Mesoplasma lactucae]|uniref:Uncharacterized protein n=1 Tax=Mesoplasma lactucae ATCC 49193 TaxID=81460 RepID=A0A291IRN0_9MOLU|nr:DUF896 domain-containing protein [Mesoplasma lactucae]ATG97404.1 hypothetical protein CP520_01355 [Mesoplasma lactucae ATCC 49193]ATZ20143.1 hypothetical protein MLACT_v1c03220 [Mesoplasma lactucae ATCC 49193]MCL8216891.1 hypothetical protein [Mesoplasma lactucae ATCC 49193]
MSEIKIKNVNDLQEDELVKEINKLTKMTKNGETLTPEQKAYQKQLRDKFINNFREGLRTQLQSVKVVDEKGNDVTPQKLKDEKEKKKG